MGEVDRVDRLTLGQSVALKFLPAELARYPERLAQFHAEVRITRQISHPHVCRTCSDLLSMVPFTMDLSAWYVDQRVMIALIVMGLAVFACSTATCGHQLFGELFFGDE
jgi:hypothetical protein